MGVIQEVLKISLSEIKRYLNIDNEYEEPLSMVSEADSYSHSMANVGFLRAHEYVTLNAVDAIVTYVDYAGSTFALDRIVSVQPLSEGTPLLYHWQNNMLLEMAESNKSMLDTYLNNNFTTQVMNTDTGFYELRVNIPLEVKTWILKKTARDYKFREAGLVTASQRESGSARVDGDMFEEIDHLRNFILR